MRRAARTELAKFLPIAAATLLIALAACGSEETDTTRTQETPAQKFVLTSVDYGDLPGWPEDGHGAALNAFLLSCVKIANLPPDRDVTGDSRTGVAADWQTVCRQAKALPAGTDEDTNAPARAFFESEFRPFEVTAPERSEGKFTGYYEAELRGARIPVPPFEVPLYRLPDDLVEVRPDEFETAPEKPIAAGRVKDGGLVPYHDRSEIEGGALSGRGLELLWVDDPVDAFILHVQGSGRVRLADGSTIRVGFAGSNGHPFVAIGRLMRARGLIEPGSAHMPAIRDWLRANPAEARALMAENPRYIFFREIDGPGPIGAHGVPLTAGRSLAVDRRIVPLGAPLWLDTTWPGDETRPLRRLVIAQDTGAAITGAVRGDLYWGTGEPAFDQAGRMNQAGRYYILLPAATAERLEAGS